MTTAASNSIRISSQLTILSKILLILIGLPICAVIATQTQFVWWGVLISLGLVAFCLWCSYITVNAFLEEKHLVVKGLFKSAQQVPLESIQNVKVFRSKKHTYFYFKSTKHKFLVISPVWGKEREALFNLYEKLTSKTA